jgi:hypothetical protein
MIKNVVSEYEEYPIGADDWALEGNINKPSKYC